MADTLALEKLYNDVVSRFFSESTNISNVFGWQSTRHRGAQQNRICWVPGDPSGAAGQVSSARNPGGNPRAIGTLDELFTVYIEAKDLTSAENELLQYKAARFIFDTWYRAAYLSVKNLLSVKSTSWMVDRTTRRFGATLQVICEIKAMVPDSVYIDAAESEDLEATAAIELDSDGIDPVASEDLEIPPLEES